MNINFNGTHTTSYKDKKPEKYTFTNDVAVMEGLEEKFQSGLITNASIKNEGDKLCINCRVDDELEITTTTSKNNAESTISITSIDGDMVHNLSICTDDRSGASPEELAQGIKNFVDSLQKRVKETIETFQKTVNDNAMNLLTLKK